MTWTQTTVTLLDGGTPSIPRTFIAYTDGVNFAFAHPLVDNTGAIIAPATSGAQATSNTALAAIEAAVQVQVGSVGIDHSANQPTLPNVGAVFGVSGPYANWVLVKTAPANPTRALIDVENTSGAPILVMRDDGTAANGSPPVNASLIPLAGGAAAGAQGGSYASSTFKGRIQIYAASGAADVTVFED